jgi:hypothetical protein
MTFPILPADIDEPPIGRHSASCAEAEGRLAEDRKSLARLPDAYPIPLAKFGVDNRSQ